MEITQSVVTKYTQIFNTMMKYLFKYVTLKIRCSLSKFDT